MVANSVVDTAEQIDLGYEVDTAAEEDVLALNYSYEDMYYSDEDEVALNDNEDMYSDEEEDEVALNDNEDMYSDEEGDEVALNDYEDMYPDEEDVLYLDKDEVEEINSDHFDDLAKEEGVGLYERACVDDHVLQTTSFCNVYMIHDPSKMVMVSQESSPFWHNRTMNVEFVLNSVFRAKKHGEKPSTFTCFAISPPLSSHLQGKVRIICATAAHCYDGVISKVEACRGSAAYGYFFNIIGFDCPVEVKHRDANIAMFEVVVDEANKMRPQGFLLPCSPDGCTDVAEFGYPCIQRALQEARQELVDGTHEHGVWEMYKSAIGIGVPKQKLCELLFETFGDIRTGDLVCSPGRVVRGEDCSTLLVRSSTLPGSSGAPLLVSSPSRQGFFCGIHATSMKHAEFNTATSTDSEAFVAFYRDLVLPYLREEDLMMWKDITPFTCWLQKHGLYKLRSRRMPDETCLG